MAETSTEDKVYVAADGLNRGEEIVIRGLMELGGDAVVEKYAAVVIRTRDLLVSQLVIGDRDKVVAILDYLSAAADKVELALKK